jgi:hypothetical protein
MDVENNNRGYTFHIKKDKDNNIAYEFEEKKSQIEYSKQSRNELNEFANPF